MASESGGRTYAGVDADTRRLERRARLVASAIELFGAQGFAKTTVQALCEHAGLSKGYFYESFPNLEAILIAAYEDAALTTQNYVLEQIGGITDLREAAREGITFYLQYISDNPVVGRLLYVEVLGVSPEVDQAYRHGVGLITEVVDAVIQLTPLARHAPRLLPTALAGLVAGTALQWCIDDWADPVCDVADAIMMMIDPLLELASPAVP